MALLFLLAVILPYIFYYTLVASLFSSNPLAPVLFIMLLSGAIAPFFLLRGLHVYRELSSNGLVHQ